MVRCGSKRLRVLPSPGNATPCLDFSRYWWVRGAQLSESSCLARHDGILDGSAMLTGRHFAGEEYRGGLAVETVRARAWRGVAGRVGIRRELAELTGWSAQFVAASLDA